MPRWEVGNGRGLQTRRLRQELVTCHTPATSQTFLKRLPVASIERKLNDILRHLACMDNRLAALAQALADIQAFLAAGSDKEALQQLTAKLKASSDSLEASVEANQPKQ